MTNLDSLQEIKKIDKQNVLGSVKSLPDQCLHAWEDANKVNVPNSYKNIENVVMCGMGGSGLGARVIESVFADQLKVPLVRVNDYNLPNFVNQNSLVVCSSYSGTTEEVISNAKQAIAKKTKWMAIASSGTLLELAKEKKVPYYKINPKYNPSDQPRMAIGYSVISQLVLASKTGLFDLSLKEIKTTIKFIQEMQNQLKAETSLKQNPAKKLANKLINKNVFYIASRHLVGAIHTVNNQLNENAKTLSADYQIPELNHHLMEGLKHPTTNNNHVFMFFANSNLYPENIQKRFAITQDVVSKNNIEKFTYQCKAPTKLSQAFELIQFGGFVNLYLSVLYGQNPAPIPWVDYFKTKLGQPLGK